jgi:hypothetical protein
MATVAISTNDNNAMQLVSRRDFPQDMQVDIMHIKMRAPAAVPNGKYIKLPSSKYGLSSQVEPSNDWM